MITFCLFVLTKNDILSISTLFLGCVVYTLSPNNVVLVQSVNINPKSI